MGLTHMQWVPVGLDDVVDPPTEIVSAQTNTATPSSTSALPAPKFTTNNKLHAQQHTQTIITRVNHYLNKKITSLLSSFKMQMKRGGRF